MTETNIIIARNLAEMAVKGAELVFSLTRNRAPEGEFSYPRRESMIALSGGRTPEALYRHLGREHPELQKARQDDSDAEDVQAYGPEFLYSMIFWSDERCVPPASNRSNYGLAYREMLEPLDFPESQIFPMMCGGSPEEAAGRYEAAIHKAFAYLWSEQWRMANLLHAEDACAPTLNPEEWERFDLVMLGMGADGHTASLFPGSPALAEGERWIVATAHPETGEERLTMTLPCINRSRQVMFMVSGEDKAETVRRVMSGGSDLPAALVAPSDGKVTWILDEAAAAKL